MSLKEFLRKRSEKGRALKEILEAKRLEQVSEERMKTPNERDLEKFMEKERQEQIKQQLQKFKEKEKKEIFSGGLMDKENIFKGHKNILGGKKLFPMKQTMVEHGGFFK